jgi:glyoxylase-like metal-dependent hydrolase (beta-lactamase superfamily II)
MHDSVIVEHFAVGPLACTCTIVADPASGEAIVIDGGDEAESIHARLEALGVRARYLVHTHAHVDHIGCLGALRELTGAQGLLHPGDLPLYTTVREQARWLGMRPPSVAKLDAELRDGDRLSAGSATLEVIHTPGHTPGSVTFALSAPQIPPRLLSGDTLFQGSIGRTDLGGTSVEELVASIRTKLLPYPDETVVIPGHGPPTTIGKEKQTNPFLK